MRDYCDFFFSCNLQIFRIPVKGMKWKQMFPVMLAPNIPHSKTEYFQAPLKAFQENSHLSNINKNKGCLFFFLIKKTSGFSAKEIGPGIEGHTVSLKPDENLSLVLSSPACHIFYILCGRIAGKTDVLSWAFSYPYPLQYGFLSMLVSG